MKLAFYQAAMLSVYVNAAATQSIDEEASYFPDLLVQTASILDYFYPQVEDELSAGTTLAQSDSITESADIYAEVDADLDADLEAEISADNEADVDADVDADIEAELSADNEAELEGELSADNEVDAELYADAEAETEVDVDADAEHDGSSTTRIKVKDDKNTDVSIEMPAMEKKKITFNSPVLTVEDDGFNSGKHMPAGRSLGGGKMNGMAQLSAQSNIGDMGAAQVNI